MIFKHVSLLMPALLLTGSLHAAVYTNSDFANAEMEQRYWHLASELRCLVCQNQSLADSNAELAGDLRRALYEQLHSGKNDQQIRAYLVARYGNFVLYKPPLNPSTALLWASPALLLLVGALLLLMVLQRYRSRYQQQNPAPTAAQLDKEA